LADVAGLGAEGRVLSKLRAAVIWVKEKLEVVVPEVFAGGVG
jgi:hypothetical protein